jgi:hypothetical protein
LLNLHVFLLQGVGKCPNWTPKYWGYNFQQILENYVQNPQNETFTKPFVTHTCSHTRLLFVNWTWHIFWRFTDHIF